MSRWFLTAALLGLPHVAAAAEPLSLVVLADDKLSRLELTIDVDGRGVSEIWNDTFAKMVAHFERNGDGLLDEAEAAKLPSAFSLRQSMWSRPGPYAGNRLPFKEFDADKNGKLNAAELAAYYRAHGLGSLLIGVGRPQAAPAFTKALVKILDADGDGKVTEAEWKAAPESLRKLDRNDDELVGPGELVPRANYPGAIGGLLLLPAGAAEKPVPELENLPLLVLPADPKDTQWATLILTRCDANKDGALDAKESGLSAVDFAKLDADKDGKLTAAELVAWRGLPPAAKSVIHLGKTPALESPAAAAFGSIRIDLRSDAGKTPKYMADGRKVFLDKFTDGDANSDGIVEAKEIGKPNQYEVRELLLAADRDGDGKLSKVELESWLDLQEQVAAGHVLLTVIDHGAGLFELLDANHDGAVSVPEQRQALARVKEAGCLVNGVFDEKKLPRQFVATIAQGHPANPLGVTKREGPQWFKAMDRNGDGYVSRREFTGTPELFDKLDLDKDGFLAPAEAAKAERK